MPDVRQGGVFYNSPANEDATESVLIAVICKAYGIPKQYSLAALAQQALEKLIPMPAIITASTLTSYPIMHTAEYLPNTPVETDLSPWTPEKGLEMSPWTAAEETPENGEPEPYAPKSTRRLWPFGEGKE